MSEFSGDWAAGQAHGFSVGYAAAQKDFANKQQASPQSSLTEQLQSITETMDTEIKKFLAIVNTMPFNKTEFLMLAKKRSFIRFLLDLLIVEWTIDLSVL